MPTTVAAVPFLDSKHNTTLSQEETDAVNTRIEEMR